MLSTSPKRCNRVVTPVSLQLYRHDSCLCLVVAALLLLYCCCCTAITAAAVVLLLLRRLDSSGRSLPQLKIAASSHEYIAPTCTIRTSRHHTQSVSLYHTYTSRPCLCLCWMAAAVLLTAVAPLLCSSTHCVVLLLLCLVLLLCCSL